MILKGLILLGVAVTIRGLAISEQKVVKYINPVYKGHHGELEHIGEHKPEHHDHYAWSHPKYEFMYKVEDPHTHDFKGQEEMRDGDLVKGEYWLIQPDGKKRTVKYQADKHNGFVADVSYSHPDHHEHQEDNEHYDKAVHEVHVEHPHEERKIEVEEVVEEEPLQEEHVQEEPRHEEEMHEEPKEEEPKHEEHNPIVVEHMVKIEHKHHDEHGHHEEHYDHHPIVHHDVRYHKEHHSYPAHYEHHVDHHLHQGHHHRNHHSRQHEHREPEVRQSAPVRLHKPMVYENYERPQAHHHDVNSNLRYYRHSKP